MTDAMLYTVRDRFRAFAAEAAKPEHFTLDEGTPASSQIILESPNWTPYCLDHPNRRVLFVELPPEVDLSKAVFIYLPQFEHARRVLSVPYESLAGLAAQIPPPKRIVFIFSMMRSGTTLVSHMFNQVPDVWSLSEPDVFMNIAQLTQRADHEDLSDVVKQCTRLLFRPIPGCAADTLALKFRSQSLFNAEWFYQGFPDARYLFLYRDGVSWMHSVYQFVVRLGFPVERTDDEALNRLAWRLVTNREDTTELTELTGYHIEDVPLCVINALGYAIQAEQYLETLALGIPYCAIRYNELNADRERVVAHMLEHCGLPVTALPDVMHAFDEDSQGGTVLARDGVTRALSAEDDALFLSTLARHPRINSPDIILPDIYHPDRVP